MVARKWSKHSTWSSTFIQSCVMYGCCAFMQDIIFCTTYDYRHFHMACNWTIFFQVWNDKRMDISNTQDATFMEITLGSQVRWGFFIMSYYAVNGPTSITRLASFENVAKISQFKFLDPPTHTTNFGGGYKSFRPPHAH